MSKREIFSIPNLMSYFRIFLIPFLVWRILVANTTRDYWIVAVLVGISGLTDLLDGKVARKFDMVTELGKALDPIADKLTLGAIIFCLVVKNPIVWIIVILYIIKEGYMGIMGLLLLKRNGRKLDGAKWYGKVCTAVLYFMLFLFMLFPDMPQWLIMMFVGICFLIMSFTFISYILVFREMWKMDSELIDWVNALQIGGIPLEKIQKELPFVGVIVKKDEDLDTVRDRVN